MVPGKKKLLLSLAALVLAAAGLFVLRDAVYRAFYGLGKALAGGIPEVSTGPSMFIM